MDEANLIVASGRAQVVRDGAEQRASEAVDLLEELDAVDAFAKLRPLERDREVVRQGREQLARGAFVRQPAQHEQANRTTGCREREGLDRLGGGGGAERHRHRRARAELGELGIGDRRPR